MRKKHIFLSIALGVATLGGITSALILNQNDNNTNIEIKNEKLPFDAKESTNILDDKLDIFEDVAFEAKLNQSNESIDITSPKMGIQKAVYTENNKNYIALRYYAAITSLDVNAMWTRKIYDGNNVLKNESTIQSSKAYSSVTCNGETIYPDDLGSEYKYFVIYTMYDIPEEASDYTLDLMVTLSNDNKSISSKTVSAQTSEAGSVNSYEMNLSLHKTSGENGTYVTNSAKTIYKIGEEVNTNNILASDESGNNLSIELDSSVNTTTLGRKNVILKSNRYQASYDIYVLDSNGAYINEDGAYVVTVNQNYNGNIGEVDGINGNMFTTISQALEYLSNSDFVDQTKNKILNISAGYYFEKLDINTPNLTINGAGSTCHATYYESELDKDIDYDANKFNSSTIIEYDSLYGIEEIDGFKHSTNSTQTIQVNKNAVNCKINNVVISNKYNNIKAFNHTPVEGYTEENKTVTYAGNGERGLALLVKSDQFVIENSAILGWQDTLELFTGRQYFKNVYITGAVDYIFGTNSTTLFDGCTINTVKSKTNYTDDSQNTAYITATKGSHSNDNDYINYGLIFNECNFTTSSDYVGKYAIARPWYKYSAVAVINSTFNDKVLTNESETIKTGLINDVNIDTLKIKFYGNNVSFIDDLENVNTILTESDAQDYINYKKIFAKKNGGVSYDLAWDPINGVETDNNTYYIFHGTVPTTGTVYQLDSSLDNTSFTTALGDVEFNNCYKRTEQDGDVRVDGYVSIDVKAGTTLTVNTYKGYHGYKIGDVYANADSITYYFANAQTVKLEKVSSSYYLYSIIINETLLEPESPVLSSLTVSGYPSSDIQVGDDCDLSNLKVKANYDDGTYINVDSFTTNADTVIDKNKAGTYTVTVTYNDGVTTKTTTFDVKYVSVVSDTFDEDAIIDFSSSDALAQSLLNSKITYAAGFTYDDHTDSIQLQSSTSYFSFKVKAGATVIVTSFGGGYGYLLINGVSNNSASTTNITAETDMTITIAAENSENTGGYSKSYLKKIQIIYPAVISTNTTISFGNNSNIDSISGVKNEATLRPNGNNSQFSAGTITLSVAAGATVTVYGYGGSKGTKAGNYTYYTVTANNAVSSVQNGDYSVTVLNQGDVIITSTDSNNYLMSIEITF